jgi:hypothetical protein
MHLRKHFMSSKQPNPVGRANSSACHAGCSDAFARAAVAPHSAVAHLWALAASARL